MTQAITDPNTGQPLPDLEPHRGAAPGAIASPLTRREPCGRAHAAVVMPAPLPVRLQPPPPRPLEASQPRPVVITAAPAYGSLLERLGSDAEPADDRGD